MSFGEIWVVRHGQTEWSLSGRHTGSSDIPLTDAGREEAAAIGRYLAGRQFSLVLVSPLGRAQESCRIAGYSEVAQIDPDVREWSYGDYEGLTTAEIRVGRPGWSLWDDGPAGGEPVEAVGVRAKRVIARAEAAGGDVLLIAHGHILRILAACWLGLPPNGGRLFALGTASIGILGHERETRVLERWNLPTK